jgi:type II secretory pathway component GspD/PulD (secretin)
VRDNVLTQGIEAVAPGLNVYGQLGDSLEVFVNALESTSKFKVLSRPSIYAANNKKAVITSGQRIPVPTSSLTDFEGDSTNVRTNIEFQDVVLKLEVVPLINSDQEVTLTIAQVNDNVVGQQRVADNTVPIIGTEKLTTTVTIPNRSTVVLGGLITESEDKTDEGVPLVSRIPVIGNAFKNSTSNTTRKELVVFIQPTVVQDNPELFSASRSEDLRTSVGSNVAETFPPGDAVLAEERGDQPQVHSAKGGTKVEKAKLKRWTWRSLLPAKRR